MLPIFFYIHKYSKLPLSISRQALFFYTLFALSGCTPLSLQEQNELGDQVSEEIEKTSNLLSDQELNQYINAIAEQFISQPPETGHDFTIHIVASKAFNAFAVAGGNIYITTGLIKGCRNVSELASIIAHEVAHIKLGHIEESYRANKVSKTIADFTGITLAIATANPFLIGAGDLFANVGSKAYVTTHSRNSEREADELAFQMMLSTGYDVRSQLTIFSRLEIASSTRKSQLPFLTTHPLPSDRVEDVKLRISLLKGYRPDIISDAGLLESIQTTLP